MLVLNKTSLLVLRVLAKISSKNLLLNFQESSSDNFQESSSDNFQESSSDNFEESPRREEFSTKNWSKEKIVLGLLMTNISKFEELQKRANLSTNNLDTILTRS